jgi:predicted acyltransferase
VSASGGRDLSLDVLRGVAVGGMVLVNLQSDGAAAYRQLAHAPWHGVTLADTVFPLFLLAVGISAALAAERAPRLSRTRIVQRAALLFLIGLALGWCLRPTLDPTQLRIMGVLQRIAIVYAVVALLCRTVTGGARPLLLAAGVLALHGWLLLMPPPGGGAASLAQGEGMSAWADQWLPGRLFRPTYDPEGVLSTLSAIASALVGASAQRLLRAHGRAALAALGAACLGAAVLTAGVLPYNKPLWTPSFALLNAGGGLLLWAVLRAVPQPRPLVWLGQVALTLYVVHMLLMVPLIQRVDGERVMTRLDRGLRDAGFAPPLASLVFAIAAGAIALAITRTLDRRGWRIRV